MTGKVHRIAQTPGGYRAKGLVRVVFHKGSQTWVAYAWPKTAGAQTPGRKMAQGFFSKSVKLIKQASAEDYAAAQDLAANTPFLTRDLLMSASFGTLVTVNMADGRQFVGRRTYVLDIQAVLDSITDIVGSILTRTADGWVGIDPGAEGEALTAHGPGADLSWEVPAGGVTEIDTASGIKGGPINAGNPSGTIELDDVADGHLLANLSGGLASPNSQTVTALLDHVLGNAEGAIIVRGATAWGVLNPGTAGQILECGGSSALPDWRAAPHEVPSIADGKVLANVTGAATYPAGVTVDALLDHVYGSTRGALIYRGASGWQILVPAVSGYVLTDAGVGADPHWAPSPTAPATITPDFNPPLSTDFATAINGVVAVDDPLGLGLDSNANGGSKMYARLKAMPSGDRTWIIRAVADDLTDFYGYIGMCFRNSVSGKYLFLGSRIFSTQILPDFAKWSDANTYSADIALSAVVVDHSCWYKFVYTASSATLAAYTSNSGLNWRLLGSDNTYLGAPTDVGLCVAASSGLGVHAQGAIPYWHQS